MEKMVLRYKSNRIRFKMVIFKSRNLKNTAKGVLNKEDSIPKKLSFMKTPQ